MSTLRVQYVAREMGIDESIRRAVGPVGLSFVTSEYNVRTKTRTIDFEFPTRHSAVAAEKRVLHLNRIGCMIHGLKTRIEDPS